MVVKIPNIYHMHYNVIQFHKMKEIVIITTIDMRNTTIIWSDLKKKKNFNEAGSFPFQ